GSDEHAVRMHRPPFRRILRGDRFASFRNPGRWSVTVVPVTQRAHDRINEVGRCLESKGDRIADVQISDPLAASLYALSLNNDVANRIGKPLDPEGCRDG